MRHFCSQRGERCRSSYKKKSEAPGCLDSPNRPSAQVSVLRPAWSGMMNRVSPPSAPLLTLGHHVKACTNQAPAPPPSPFPSFYSSWAHATSRYTTLHSKQMQTLSHMPVYLRDINKIKRTFVWARNNYTHMRALLQSTLWCHCRERVYCGTHSRHSSLTAIKNKKKTHYKTMRIRKYLARQLCIPFVSPRQEVRGINFVLLSDSAEGTEFRFYVPSHNTRGRITRRPASIKP